MAQDRQDQVRDVAMPNDVGQWGEKDVMGAYDGPLTIAGERVDMASLPAFGENERVKPKAPARGKG